MEDKKIENFGIRLKFAQGLLKVRYPGTLLMKEKILKFSNLKDPFK